MRIYIYMMGICLLYGCPAPAVIDPAPGTLNILNYTDKAVYVYYTCSDTLPCEYGLTLFLNRGKGSTDQCGNEKKDTIAPEYRINAFSWGILLGFGNPDAPVTNCSDKVLRLYFITESTMRTKTWEEICANQLYQKKMVLTQAYLDSICWRVIYQQP